MHCLITQKAQWHISRTTVVHLRHEAGALALSIPRPHIQNTTRTQVPSLYRCSEIVPQPYRNRTATVPQPYRNRATTAQASLSAREAAVREAETLRSENVGLVRRLVEVRACVPHRMLSIAYRCLPRDRIQHAEKELVSVSQSFC